MGVEAIAADETVGQGQRHGGVVGPLPRGEPEQTAARHGRVVGEAVAHGELERGAKGITDGEPEQSTEGTIVNGSGLFVGVRLQNGSSGISR